MTKLAAAFSHPGDAFLPPLECLLLVEPHMEVLKAQNPGKPASNFRGKEIRGMIWSSLVTNAVCQDMKKGKWELGSSRHERPVTEHLAPRASHARVR